MKKFLLLLAILAWATPGFSAQQMLNYSTRTNWATEGAKVQSNFTELYNVKPDRATAGLLWDAWPAGSSFSAASAPVWYNGVWYKCLGTYTKVDGDTPDLLPSSFEAASGAGGGGGAAATTTFTPFLTIAAADVQAAFQEFYAEAALDTEVITKGTSTAYTPVTSNDPVNKGYVDAQVIAAGGYNDEQAQDAISSMIAAGMSTGLSVTYNDAGNSLSLGLNPSYMAATYQLKDSDLDAIAGMTTTVYGRGLLDDTTASQAVTTLGFGNAALATVGTATGNVVGLVDSGGSPALPFSISYNSLDDKPTSATVGGLFSGTDTYLKKDGTTGPGGASNLAAISDWPGSVSATEVSYLDGLTGGIQGQINALAVTGFAPTIQAGAPNASSATGPFINTSNNHFIYNVNNAGYYDLTAATYTAHTSLPIFSARTIATNGTTLTLTGSVSLSVGAGGSGGFDIDCSSAGVNIPATYTSGSPGTSLVFTLGSTIYSGDSCDLDYTQPGNGIEATTGGADVSTVVSAAVTNNSTQTSSTSDNFNRADGALGGSWAAASTALTGLTISSNLVTTGSDWTPGAGRYSTSTSDISQAVVKGNTPAGGGTAQVCSRMNSSSDGYCAYLRTPSGGNYTELGVQKDGNWLCDVSSLSYSTSSDHTVRISVTGTSPAVISVSVDGTTVTSGCSDSSTPLTSGNPGIKIFPDGSPRPQIDNWQAY